MIRFRPHIYIYKVYFIKGHFCPPPVRPLRKGKAPPAPPSPASLGITLLRKLFMYLKLFCPSCSNAFNLAKVNNLYCLSLLYYTYKAKIVYFCASCMAAVCSSQTISPRAKKTFFSHNPSHDYNAYLQNTDAKK